MIDIRDAIETFVPLAKRLGWLTRRLTGLVSSTIGGIALGMVTTQPNQKVQPVKIAVGMHDGGEKVANAIFGESSSYSDSSILSILSE